MIPARDVLDPLVAWIAQHPETAAPVVALVASYLLYGVLGRRYLGADDDYWEQIRRRVLPVLDAIGSAGGLYAEDRSHQRELAAIFPADSEKVEPQLERMGFHRNPLAAYKQAPGGQQSVGSWARRNGAPWVRGLGEVAERRLNGLPIGGWPLTTLARFVAALGDVLSTHQVHVTLYEVEEQTEGGDPRTVTRAYVHHEFNALNPATALLHYRGVGISAAKGVEKFQMALDHHDVTYAEPDDAA